MKRKCRRCGRPFVPVKWNHIFCGSKSRQSGCSWINATRDRSKRRWQNENYKNYQRSYGKKWHKMQRKLNTIYARKQREKKRQYYQSYKGRTEQREWRKKNIGKILFWNKKRALRQKNVIGSHTWKHWEELKARYQYRCAICGISERELKEKWPDGKFAKLTEDHIIPISKHGTDYINNIQPLCVNCNAKKKDK